MKLYNALVKKNKEGKVEDVILLKEGFSVCAFLFSGAWFLYHKMWQEFLALLLINIVFIFLGNFYSNFDRIFLQTAFIFIVAFNANYWLCSHLKKKGYELAGLFFGADCDDARLSFVKNFMVGSNSILPEFDDLILKPKYRR
jgi:hypothetical protein